MNKKLLRLRKVMAVLLTLALAFTGIMPVTVYASETSKEANQEKFVDVMNSNEASLLSAGTTAYEDPIEPSDITEGVITIDKAYEAEAGTTITVIGQIQYRYGKNGNVNTTIIEDVIDGEVYGFQIYDSLSGFEVGDVIAITGVISEYSGVKQLQKPSEGFTPTKLKHATCIGAQSVTIAQLLEGGDKYLSEYVLIKDATLGAYTTTNTPIQDETGKSINIYQSVAYPESLGENDKANVYGVFSKYKETYQLRNGKVEESFKKSGYEVDDSIQTSLAKWAGTAKFEGNMAYGDLNEENDFLDTNAKFTLSNRKAPQYINEDKKNNRIEYNIGSVGLAIGEYYQLELSTDKYAAVGLDFKLRSSASGPKFYNVLYSTDGVNFEKAQKISYTLNITTYVDGVAQNSSKTYKNMDKFEATNSWQSYHVAFPDGAANAEKLTVRIQIPAENQRIDNKTTDISTSYTCRFTSIEVVGSPILSSDICRVVTVEPDEQQVAVGTELTLKCETEEAQIFYKLNQKEYALYNEAEKPVLTELPATLKVYAKAEGKTDSVVSTYNFTQAQVATVKVSPNGGSAQVGSQVKLSCETEGAEIYYSLDDGNTYQVYKDKITLDKLPQTIKTYAKVEGCLQSVEKMVTFTERSNSNYKPYFGQIHSHTNYSDGAGTAEDAFTFAKEKADDIDFLAVTDHSNYFDNDTKATITDGSVSTEWKEGHELADKFTDDKFVGIMGYEMTWSGGAPGHMNTFNTNGFLSRNMTGYGNGSSSSLVNYYASLKTVTDSISQFNHPGTTFGDFYDFSYYDKEIDQLITTIEVGNGEGAIGSTGYFPSYEYYTRALDKGWHVAPTNNQDNHKGYWGSANTGRTVVLADSLTRDNIYDALRNMRVYATEDSNLSIQYTLNGEVMGTILEETPDAVEIAVSLEDANADEKIGKVEVIVNGGLSVASETVNGNKADVKFSLPANYSYYYIKVTQADKDIAVTAPVWIGDVDAAGISEVSTKSSLQVQNESVDIKTDIYNNNAKDMDINSIVFTIGDKEIKKLEGEDLVKVGLNKLASQKTASYEFDFVYGGLGNTTVNVVVNATMNGVSKVYANKLELNYVPREMISKVIVDGTHFNDYVNGYYKDSITELGQLAAKSYQEIIVKEDKITKEDLADCSLLIVTSPAKTSGTTNSGISYSPTKFEDSFIQLVVDYVKNGGKVVLCGIADYKDSKDVQTSTEMNRLLEAMGATTRVNSDELVDEVSNPKEKYRLYFDDYNTSSKYLDGLVNGMTYSCYSGCGILLDKDAVASGKAEAIVYGHDTTYSIDSKKMDSNYVEQEKGSIVALAHENVGENGGGIWVGGTVFLSNFEIDTEIKNNSDKLSYANTVIAANILKECQKQKKVTDIATVRKASEGEIFTIEGYVTAGTTKVETTFFDCIYMQDDTAGIDIFPFATQGVAIGQKIQITGYVASYQGDKELMVMSYKLLDGNKVYEPKKLTTQEATDYESFGGSLVEVQGAITKVDYAENVLNYIYLEDKSGVTCKVLTDGYIGSTSGAAKVEEFAKVGNVISAVGILYMNPDGPCLRTRDRDEIKLIKSNSIIYEPNGGENPSDSQDSFVPGEEVALPTPVKTGYLFGGWYYDAAFTKKVTVIDTSKEQDVNLYAKWTPIKYKIVFQKNSSRTTGTMKAITATYDKTCKLTKSKFTRKGYVFAGWATSPNGKVVYKNQSSVKNLTAANNKTINLYAKWTKVTVGKVKNVSVKAINSKSAKVTWKKVSNAVGYEVIYSAKSNFKGTKTIRVSSKTLSKTITGLKANKTYYVKVRAYKKDSAGERVYGSSSSVKKITSNK